MLTVLIRYKDRREVLFPAQSVEFTPRGREDSGLLISYGVGAEGGRHLDMTPEGDEDFRDVFVMNSAGQTVARYVL